MSNATELIEGDEVWVTGTILCDEEYQLREILEAQTSSFEAGTRVYAKWTNTIGINGDPSCYMYAGDLGMYVKIVGTVGEVTGVKFPDFSVDSYIVAVLWRYAQDDWRPGFIASVKKSQKSGLAL